MADFATSFDIGSRRIGGEGAVLFIAEAGVAHFGDINKAIALVDLAADAGADVLKTQAFSTDAMIANDLPEWRERMAPKEVDRAFIEKMKARCDERGIMFMCTAHDEVVLPWVDELGVVAHKIGSGERGNVSFLKKVGSLGKPVILSTGMYAPADVEQALSALAAGGCREVALLHCVTSYPTPVGEVNLRAMETLRSMFPGPVGYSDHTQGSHVPLAAVALGARIIEKHISLDFNVPNAQDWKVSAGPHDLASLVRQVREVEASLGHPEKRVQPCEEGALGWALKRLVACSDLAEGQIIQADDLVAKRAHHGIPPSEIDQVVGRRLSRELKTDHVLRWEDLA